MKPTSLLITTKFAPPRIGRYSVHREALLDSLHQARHSRLVVLCGSAGFGKTTLLAQWRQDLIKNGATVAWLSLAQEDGEPEQFCANLIGTLQQAGLSMDELSTISLNEDLQLLPPLIINTLARWPSELYLLIDDFQHITSPRLLLMIQALLDNAPNNLHLVLASRSKPGLLLGRLRAMDELFEVGDSHLAFNFHESMELLKAYLDAGIDLELARSLHDKTDGWPIGLQLMSIALKNNPHKRSRTEALLPTSAALGDYLDEDVIADLPAELLEFLYQISILLRFNVEVAGYVTGSPRAAELIAMLEARNLFLLPLDLPGRYQWYRLHPLFAEFLSQRLALSGIDTQPLHRRAAHWFEEARLVSEAVRHTLQCADVDLLVQLLERVQPSQRSISNLRQFLCWLDQVPLAVLLQHPNLLLLGIWSCVLTLLTDKADTWIKALETGSKVAEWAPQLALLKAAIALQRDDIPRCFAYLETLTDTALDNNFQEQARVSLTLGCLCQMGRYAEARGLFQSQAGRVVRHGDEEMALVGHTSLATVALFEGAVLEAERIAAPVLLQAERLYGRRAVSTCYCAMAMAEVFYEQDRIDEAREVLANRMDVLRFSVPDRMISVALSHARVQYLQESPRKALDYLAKRAEYFRDAGLDRGLANMLAEQIRMGLQCGDWRHAETLLAALDVIKDRDYEASPRNAEIVSLAALSRARLALTWKHPEAALLELQVVARLASEFDRGIVKVRVDILQALALQALGRDSEAAERSHSALASGYRLGLKRSLLDEGEAFQQLLKDLDLDDLPLLDEYRDSLLQQDEQPPETSASEKLPKDSQGLLTKRELEILTLMSQSMSNKHIALTLSISLQTVKWYVKSIFHKLGVSRRYDAVVAGRNRDILPKQI
ncbi:LuxR C-terminal-related transcriptional regulator [Pseudomonas sp. LS44]|uniref:helix-turn-helix transcriptional regulator n=1 Tax=Pseudomonas sp. LS44 TaxID=1357074 RepID=UPI00215A256D|nr:LuxR C-terminal-related transcriptional regulator [Pseudomonas sp. LS44]UVE16013.1 LuxR C-terminal-related transcriptional regulator [Pseudomonas sp. LS44]